MMLAGAVMAVSMLCTMPTFAAETTDGSQAGYVTASLLNVREGSSTDYNVVGRLKQGSTVSILGQEDNGWYEISYNGTSYYVSDDYITTDEDSKSDSTTTSSTWSGPVLSAYAGTVTGPSGRETYYNLNMSSIVSMMHSLGYSGEYWVRSDGVKMLGDYVMVAANLSVHPRGSLVETSLGTGIVCDTGGFAASNPNQLDIATTW